MSYDLLSDEMLVKLLKVSDENAFKMIYQRYWKIIFQKALSRLRSSELAEDLTQSIFVSLWYRRESCTINNLSAYLQTAIKYKIINYIESSYSKQVSVEFQTLEMVSDNSTDNEIRLHELQVAIDNAIQLLPAKTREVFKLSRFDRFSIKEIANHMNISEKAVEYHITQSLKLLRLELKDFMMFSVLSAILLD